MRRADELLEVAHRGRGGGKEGAARLDVHALWSGEYDRAGRGTAGIHVAATLGDSSSLAASIAGLCVRGRAPSPLAPRHPSADNFPMKPDIKLTSLTFTKPFLLSPTPPPCSIADRAHGDQGTR